MNIPDAVLARHLSPPWLSWLRRVCSSPCPPSTPLSPSLLRPESRQGSIFLPPEPSRYSTRGKTKWSETHKSWQLLISPAAFSDSLSLPLPLSSCLSPSLSHSAIVSRLSCLPVFICPSPSLFLTLSPPVLTLSFLSSQHKDPMSLDSSCRLHLHRVFFPDALDKYTFNLTFCCSLYTCSSYTCFSFTLGQACLSLNAPRSGIFFFTI